MYAYFVQKVWKFSAKRRKYLPEVWKNFQLLLLFLPNIANILPKQTNKVNDFVIFPTFIFIIRVIIDKYFMIRSDRFLNFINLLIVLLKTKDPYLKTILFLKSFNVSSFFFSWSSYFAQPFTSVERFGLIRMKVFILGWGKVGIVLDGFGILYPLI